MEWFGDDSSALHLLGSLFLLLLYQLHLRSSGIRSWKLGIPDLAEMTRKARMDGCAPLNTTDFNGWLLLLCVCGVEPGVREEFSKHLFFTLSFQLSLHTCAQSRSLSYSCPLPFLWARLVVGVMGFLCCPGLVS